jgi:hypothetical protein
LVEQLIRNQQVIGSSPIVGSISPTSSKRFLSLFLHRVWYRLSTVIFPFRLRSSQPPPHNRHRS